MENHNKITTEEQLIKLLDLKSKLPFVFSFPELTDLENKNWTEKIKKNYFACGCNTGSIFMFLTLILEIAILLLNKFILKEEIYYINYFYGLALIFLMAIIGKIVGKEISYFRLKSDMHQLKVILKMNYHNKVL